MQTDSQIDATTQADVPDNGGTLTAGDILRQERERLGLNEKEIADQLHITNSRSCPAPSSRRAI